MRRFAMAIVAMMLGCGSSGAAATGPSDDATSADDTQAGGGDSTVANDAGISGDSAIANDAGSSDSAVANDAGAGDSTSATNDASDAGSTSTKACKRGMATNIAPTSAFSPGVAWWYDWSPQPSKGGAATIAFVPMIWGAKDLGATAPAGVKELLGFNEPNFKAQSNLTPSQAAADWPKVEAIAKAAGVPIVSPAVNFCGSSTDPSGCSDPTVTDPYTWLKDFFAACPGCEVDAIAVHWYNCDLDSLKGYLEGNGAGLAGFVQFGKPIWLTEFSCNGSASVDQQTAYMKAAVPYLEGNPHVARYAWFSAAPIPNARLANDDGSPTALGATYASLAAPSCP